MFNFLSSLSSRSRGASSRKRRPFQSGLAVASEVLEARQLLTGGTFSPAAALQQANHAGLGLQLPPQVHYDIVSGHNLKSIDNSYPVHDDATPYKYAYLGNSYTFSFGSGGAKVTIGDKPLTVIIDDTSDTTPFVYAKVSTPVGSLAIAYDQGGGIPMSLTVAAAAPTHHEITTGRTTIDVIVASPSITGNFYISGYASIGIPDLPLSLNVGGEALFNLRGSLMDRVQTGALNLTSIADGHYNKGDLIGSDSSLAMNGKLSVSPDLFPSLGYSPINIDVPLANASLTIQRETTIKRAGPGGRETPGSSYTHVVFAGSTANPLANTPLGNALKVPSAAVTFETSSVNRTPSEFLTNLSGTCTVSAGNGIKLGNADFASGQTINLKFSRNNVAIDAGFMVLGSSGRLSGNLNPTTGAFNLGATLNFANLGAGATVAVALNNSAFTLQMGVNLHYHWNLGSGVSGSLDGQVSGQLTVGYNGNISGSLSGRWKDSWTKRTFQLSGGVQFSGGKYVLDIPLPDFSVGVYTVRTPDIHVVI